MIASQSSALVDYINAHPNQNYTFTPDTFAALNAQGANLNSWDSTQVTGLDSYTDTRGMSCKLFGANCVDDSQAITSDCPPYAKALNLCKALGRWDKAAVQAQQDANDAVQGSYGCTICDQVSSWAGKFAPRVGVVLVGVILLVGAFLVYRK